jgi:thioredoxin-like negative regulator of GroEL
MYTRVLITIAAMVFFWTTLSLMKRRQFAAANRASKLLDKASNMPTIVYFWSDGCHVCKNTQKRILEGILGEYGCEQLMLTAYNIDESPDVAKKWGVRTLPTTFLLDSAGTIKYVNNGLIVAETLRSQLKTMIF